MRSSAATSKPPNNLLLDAAGRGALITGANGGIGRAVTALLAAAGARVVATDLRFDDDAPVGERIAADLSRAADAAALAAAATRAGALHYVVHCAGLVGAGPLAEMKLDAWRAGIEANLTSAYLLARFTHGALAESQGALVLMSSPNGVHGGTILSGPAYAAAKAGVLNLTRYLAKEWAPDVRVNCVVPGAVDTPMLARLSTTERQTLIDATPLKRLTTPEDVASACAFLCSEHARSITGAALNVTAGRMLP
ncbi:MAG: SDR family oxidoreductase [Hyphomonadaceae bacterium]